MCRGSRRTARRSTWTSGCSRASMRCTRGATHSASAPEAKRLVERTWLDFAFAGARLPASARRRLAEIEERLATLSTQFRQNLLADESEWLLLLHDEDDLAGLPADLRAAARAAAGAARHRRRVGDHAVAFARGSLPHPLGSPRPARAGVRRVDAAAASTTARATTVRSCARSSRCAASSRTCTATRRFPTSRWSTGWPARPLRSPRCWRACGRPQARRPRRSATALAAAARARGDDIDDRAVGLAVLRREGARRALPPRRRGDQAVLRARPDAGGRVRLRAAAVRRRIRAARRTSPPTIPTCACTRCAGATAPRSASSWPTTSRGRASAAARG